MRRALTLLAVLLLTISAARAQTVVCFGDSLTAGRGASPGESYPDYLRKDLAVAGYHTTIINDGVSGDTTKDGLERIREVLRAHPAIVILELGANDGLRGEAVPGIVTRLSTIIRSLQQHRIRILLAGIYMPPNLGPDYVRQFDSIYPALAQRYHLAYIPFLLTNVFGLPDLMSDDDLHPNGAGYQIVAQTVLHALEPMLHK